MTALTMLPYLGIGKLSIEEHNHASQSGGLYEFKLRISDNTPLVVASPALQMKLQADTEKEPGFHSYKLLSAMVRAEAISRQAVDTDLDRFAKEALEYFGELLEKAKRTVESGPGLTRNGAIQHKWVVLLPWLRLRSKKVVIIDKGRHNLSSFRGTLYHVKWGTDDVAVEGIRDADDKAGPQIYTDSISFLTIACGDVYISEQDAVEP
jgi:hypothetical protein